MRKSVLSVRSLPRTIATVSFAGSKLLACGAVTPVSGMSSAAGLGMVSCIVEYKPTAASATIGSVNASVYSPMRTIILKYVMIRLLLVVKLDGPPWTRSPGGSAGIVQGLLAPGLGNHLLHRVDHQRRLFQLYSVPAAFSHDQTSVRAERRLPPLRFGPVGGLLHVLTRSQHDQRQVTKRGRRLKLAVVGGALLPFGGGGGNTPLP